MTTPNIPDLPHTLATDTTGGELVVLAVHPDGPEHGLSLRAVDKIAGGPVSGTTVSPVDVAALISELSRFVPIPAEARKVLTGVIHADTDFSGAVSSAEQTAVLALEHLAAAGLLVGPGEPAASEGEPAPDAATLVDEWLEEPSVTGRSLLDRLAAHGLTVTAKPAPRILENVRVESFGPHPHGMGQVVSVEPATAPSVEQIAEVLEPWVAEMFNPTVVAEEIRALWSPAPGDAAEESGPTVDMYEPGSVVYLDGDVWVPGKDYDEKQAENANLRAALEAAEHRANEWKAHWRIARMEDVDHDEQCIEIGIATGDMHRAARAAVAADTTEEA